VGLGDRSTTSRVRNATLVPWGIRVATRNAGGHESDGRGAAEVAWSNADATVSMSDPGDRPRGQGPLIDVSIVIPVFNEERRLEPGLELLKAALSWGTLPGRTVEIVVVDDGSTDRTSGTADRCLGWFPEAQLVQLPENLGKGAAVRAGVAAARGAAVVFMDVDMAVHPAHLTKLVGALDHADVVMGSRSHHQSRVMNSTRHRQMMGVAFHRIVRFVTELPYLDTQCGFKAFRAPVARMLFHCSSTDRFAFDVDLLTTAQRFGFRIVELPVVWRHVRGSRIRPILDPVSMILDVTRIGRRHSGAIDILAARISKNGARSDLIRSVLGPTLPILNQRDSGTLALFPLCSETNATLLVQNLARTLPTATVEPVSVSVAELETILAGPIPLRAANADGFGDDMSWNAAIT
jgi:dolichyl-phosphate beta-glucosyltransferase